MKIDRIFLLKFIHRFRQIIYKRVTKRERREQRRNLLEMHIFVVIKHERVTQTNIRK